MRWRTRRIRFVANCKGFDQRAVADDTPASGDSSCGPLPLLVSLRIGTWADLIHRDFGMKSSRQP
jgi:hypothetical protein